MLIIYLGVLFLLLSYLVYCEKKLTGSVQYDELLLLFLVLMLWPIALALVVGIGFFIIIWVIYEDSRCG